MKAKEKPIGNIYMYTWENGVVSIVFAADRATAIEVLDEIGWAEDSDRLVVVKGPAAIHLAPDHGLGIYRLGDVGFSDGLSRQLPDVADDLLEE